MSTSCSARVQVARAQLGAVHRRQHLHVAERVEAEPRRDAVADQRDDAVEDRRRAVGLDEVEVALPPAGADSGSSPWLTAWAARTIQLCPAWRKISVSRTTGTAPEAIRSASTVPGPTDGSWSTSPTSTTHAHGGTARSSWFISDDVDHRRLVDDEQVDVERVARGRA